MSEELKITKERVLATANKCENAKEVLKELFPDVFNNAIDLSAFPRFNNGCLSVEARNGGQYKGVSLYLSGGVDWRLERDDAGLLCLIPTRRY